IKPRIAGENGEGNPTVGNFSNRKVVRPESASASISFSETNRMTSWPRSRRTSATAMPGKRCPPVPPHAITAFIVNFRSLVLHPWCYSNVHGGAFLMRWVKDALSINIQQQTDPEHTRDEIRTSVTDKGQRQAFVRQERCGHTDVHRGLESQERNDAAAEEQTETIFGV